MKLCNYQWTGVVLFGLILFSCEPDGQTLIPNESEINSTKVTNDDLFNKQQDSNNPDDYFLNLLKPYESTALNTYTVEFLGRNLNETGNNATTTFRYKVTGGGETPQLDSFFLETPGCAGSIADYSPKESVKVQSNGIKWNSSVSKDGSQEYTITYQGNVPLGIINSTITRGSIEKTGKVVGPCKGVYILSGSIYIDADNDGNKQQSESGISSVFIDLNDSNNNKIGSVPTSSNGSYSFKVVQGDYRISVTGDLLGNNNYTAVSGNFIDIKDVTGNISGLNFGFKANTEKIIEDLENNILLDTKPTKYWIQQIRNAGKNNSDYKSEEIMAFLTRIEGLLLKEPFQFGDNKQKNALNILTRPIKTDLDEYLQQLLTAELNVISGRGAKLNSAESSSAFNHALLIYGEAVACRELGNCPAEENTVSAQVQTKAVGSNDTRLLKSFNGSGGI